MKDEFDDYLHDEEKDEWSTHQCPACHSWDTYWDEELECRVCRLCYHEWN